MKRVIVGLLLGAAALSAQVIIVPAPAGSVGGITITGTPAAGYIPIAQSSSAASWQVPPTPPVSGYQPNQALNGCGVHYLSGLTFRVGACTYTINGVTYSSVITDLTLTAADATLDRIDMIAVDITGVALVVDGTAAATPSQPTVDPATQLALTYVTVAAAAVIPSNFTTDNLYDEGAEWSLAVSANLTANSTNNPYHLTKDIEATAAVLTRQFTLVKPAAGTVDLANRNALVFYIRSKAAWPVGASGATAARFLSIFWQNGGTQMGSQVVLRDGVFGFSSSITTAYQQISIPTSLFGANGLPVTTLRVVVSGPAGTSSIGFYIDQVDLQSGVGTPALPTTVMNFKGTYSAVTSYAVNDTVVSSGVGYIALLANTAVALTNTTNWAKLASVSTGTYSFNLLDPVQADSGRVVWEDGKAVHLTRVGCNVKGGTNAVIAIDKRAEATPDTDSTTHVIADLTCTAGAIVSTSTFANASAQCGATSSCAVAARKPLALTITSVSGTNTELRVFVEYTVDQ